MAYLSMRTGCPRASANARVSIIAPGVVRSVASVRRRTKAQAVNTQPPYSSSTEIDAVECAPSLVVVDNSDANYTRLTLDVDEVPGLLRTLTWTLNGLGVRVQDAVIQTVSGVARDSFWVTTIAGKKLTDDEAALLKERVSDFCVACKPKCASPTEWCHGNVLISNRAHPEWTVMTIAGEPKRPGFLLEIASVLSGVGAEVKEAFIQGTPAAPGAPVDIAPADHDFKKQGRFFKFHLADRAGGKLDAARVSAVLFTYDVFTGRPAMPTVAPNVDAYLRGEVEIKGCE